LYEQENEGSGIKYTISGQVTDAETGEPVIGAAVVLDGAGGTSTDILGKYTLTTLETGRHSILFSYLAYEVLIKKITLAENVLYNLDVALTPKIMVLDPIVVTVGKYEQKQSEVTVSMEVIKSQMIDDVNPGKMSDVLDKVPGVNVLNNQINIRGGSGWSYGVGSRVLLLVDDLPLLSADAQDVKWAFLPMENVDQIEIIKGAASALYGGSALDGIIHIRTATPGSKPVTKASITTGQFDTPKQESFKHWTTPPRMGRIQAMHSRRIKRWDLITSGNFFFNQSYRKEEEIKGGRLFMRLYRRPKDVYGFKYGLSLTGYIDTAGNFLYWQDAENPYLPDTNTVSHLRNNRIAIDPFIHYTTKKDSKHSLLGRIYITDFQNDSQQESLGQVFYAEYRYQKRFEIIEDYSVTLTSGLVGNYTFIYSPGFYGDHRGENIALFAQLDQKIKKLNFSFGSRLESYKVDTFKRSVHPIFRSGIAIELAKATFLRASLGQGIRFASVAEKFTETKAGAITVFPNPNLKEETGWSSEIGIKQGYKISKLAGFLDLAVFWTEYDNLIEFIFGNYDPNSGVEGLGFKAKNVTDARIYGFEVSTLGEWAIKKSKLRFLAGYHFITPLDLKYTPSPTDTLGTEKFLKYRHRHMAKINAAYDHRLFTFGMHLNYNSFVINIDDIFNSDDRVKGGRAYREENQHGDLLIDAFLKFKILRSTHLSLHAKNIFNTEYMFIPGNMGAPRSYSVQLLFRI
ncbi:MAG: TonB-dependent receptor, partial [Bacteroidetes bacterium]|nr:TonB-dependent receptor [Bacteroidota bacterium]